jgi:hypothetical protein
MACGGRVTRHTLSDDTQPPRLMLTGAGVSPRFFGELHCAVPSVKLERSVMVKGTKGWPKPVRAMGVSCCRTAWSPIVLETLKGKTAPAG